MKINSSFFFTTFTTFTGDFTLTRYDLVQYTSNTHKHHALGSCFVVSIVSWNRAILPVSHRITSPAKQPRRTMLMDHSHLLGTDNRTATKRNTTVCIFHWKQMAVMIPTLSSSLAPEVVFMTTSGGTNDDKVGIRTTPQFRCTVSRLIHPHRDYDPITRWLHVILQ